jgi:tetratricopeptide (TPR) repeat protein
VDYFQRVLNIDATNGEIWGALGHSYLMMDELPKAFAAYQQALHHMSNPKVSCLVAAHINMIIYRNLNCGTESVSCTIATVPSSMLKKHLHLC